VRRRLGLGAVAGFVLYGTTLPWLTDFSPPGYVVMVALQTMLLAGAAALTARWWTLPGSLVLLEAVQTRFPLGGFPLPGLVHSQPDGPFVLAAPLGGALLVTGLAAAAGVAPVALVLAHGVRRRAVALTAVTAGTLLLLTAGATLSTTPAGTLDAAVVQGGGPRGTRAVFTDPGDVTARHLAVLDTLTGSPDLVLLPEGVVVVDAPLGSTTISRELADRARRLDSSLVVGVVEGEPDGFRNAAIAYDPSGALADRYEKQHRVPFGEYIPARDLLSKLTDATALVPKDAIVGRGTARLQLPRTVAGVVISYEVFFPDRVREAVRGGGQLLLVPTNASSYVGDEVPAIELAAARLRAREFGRAVLQAAPTGYSAIVLPDGQIRARSELGAPALLRDRVPLRTGLTPYARFGNLPVLTMAAVLLLSTCRLRPASKFHPSAASRRRSGRGGLPAASARPAVGTRAPSAMRALHVVVRT
jgi:apolipoprotein N-acyltransferase